MERRAGLEGAGRSVLFKGVSNRAEIHVAEGLHLEGCLRIVWFC